MAKILSCRDVGVDCDWHACAETEEELLRLAAVHAKDDHGITAIDEAMLAKVRAAVTEGPCPTSVHCC